LEEVEEEEEEEEGWSGIEQSRFFYNEII